MIDADGFGTAGSQNKKRLSLPYRQVFMRYYVLFAASKVIGEVWGWKYGRHTRDSSAWILRRRGETSWSIFRIARFALAKKPAMMSVSIDEVLRAPFD